jgi:hypothetical protein
VELVEREEYDDFLEQVQDGTAGCLIDQKGHCAKA